MSHLTEKQFNILKFILLWNSEKGFPPSLNEISENFSLASTNAVRCHLSAIQKKGYIRINHGKARGIQIIRVPETMKSCITGDKDNIPVLGQIAAGVPIWAERNIDGNVPVSPTFFGGGELFALKVCGDSMIDAGICNNDIAIIRKQAVVENGEIAAICIENEVTLKRFYKTHGRITLRAENKNYQDLVFNSNVSISVIGRLQGLLRKGQAICR